MNTVISGCEALDMDMACKVFLNSPGFRMIGMDDSLCDYQTYLDGNIQYIMNCLEFKLTTFKEETKILRGVHALNRGSHRFISPD